MYKSFAVICALALLETISGQYIGACNNYVDGFLGPYDGPYGALGYDGLAYDLPLAYDAGYGAYPGAYDIDGVYGPYGAYGPYESAYGIPVGANGYGPGSLAASNGGGLAVSSSSAIAPTGVSMVSDNAYEGLLAVSGAMPFLGAVALEGALPTAGSGAVTYGCGDGRVAIISEDYAADAAAAAAAATSAAAVAGYERYGPAYERLAYGGIAAPRACAGYALA